MPSFSHGKNTVFKITSAADVLTDISNTLRSCSFPRIVDTSETSAFGTTYKTHVVGLIGATFAIEGMFDPTVNTLIAGIIGFESPRNFEYGPQGSTTGKPKFTGAVLLTNYTSAGTITDMVSATVDFIVSGNVTLAAY